jgi:epoxyqueuosine reductase
MSRDSDAARVRELALAAGFDRVGIATVAAAATGKAYARWIAEGGQASMSYLERGAEMRQDPRSLLAGARSILCVALQYAHPASGPPPSGDFWPGVARYARGADYHDFLTERLGKARESILGEFPGCEARICVDTAPVLEREWAARAGLGSFGKNTNLLHPEGGSFFLLGELLLSLDLEPDLPLSDLCGSCTRCLDACPTGALSPYRLESSRCISYWTIETWGGIPVGIREGMGEWVFGCDICQEVCPWNSGLLGELQAEAGPRPDPPMANELHAAFSPLPALFAFDLRTVLGMPDAELRAAVRPSPLSRPKAEGLKRNVAIAMGNRRDPRYVEALSEALGQGSPLIRSVSAWALGEIGTGEAKAALAAALTTESDPAVRGELRTALETAAKPTL